MLWTLLKLRWITSLIDRMNKFILILLAPLGIVYRFIIWARNLFYDIGVFHSKELPCKVVSIGNLSLGGTGKTPAVIALSKYLKKQAVSVAVLSRGYGRKTKKTVLVTDGNEIQSDWRSVGDEAFLIAHSLKSIPVVVDNNRVRGGNYLIKNYNPDIIILDDAFQHRRIKRDIEIVLLNCIETLENHRLIPFGNLREPLGQLKRADIIILSKTNLGDFPENIHIEQFSNGALHKAYIEAETFLLDKDQTKIPSHNYHNKKCVLVTGVGSPSGVLKTAHKIDLTIATHLRFRDHHVYNENDCKKINKAIIEKKCDYILTTEKDMIKLCSVSDKNIALSLSNEIYSLPIRFVFQDKTLDMIRTKLC